MPTQLRSPSIQFLVLFVGLALFAAAFVGLSNTGAASVDEETARLEVAGTTYLFTPSTCTITETDFLASGSGDIGGEPFWVSASGDRFDLAVGPNNEEERPAEDQLWLISVDDVRWSAADQTITASAIMRDERDTTAESLRGTLSVECSPA